MSRHAASGTGTVRIIGGEWRGTKLPVAQAEGLRPTADRVRETLFNWLQPMLAGARVLDLFAGSGALGLEAVSRGAREAWLVERDARLASTLRETVSRLQGDPRVQVVQADALAWLQGAPPARFDGVFLDPPFDAGLWSKVLVRVQPWLAEGAWLYLEAPLRLASSPVPGAGWIEHRSGQTREVRYTLYRWRGGGAATLQADSHAEGGTSSA